MKTIEHTKKLDMKQIFENIDLKICQRETIHKNIKRIYKLSTIRFAVNILSVEQNNFIRNLYSVC